MKNHIKIWTITLLVLVQSSMAFTQDFKTIGYFPTYRFSAINNIEFDKLTHINIAFAIPDNQGYLSTDGADITPVVEQAHDAGLEVYIALAGGASPLSDWEDWITPANRSSFISDIIDYVNIHDLQGVDVDIEWNTVNDDYSGFVIELKDSLELYDLGLSAALPGIYRYPEISTEALEVFDWVNLMIYDFTGPWAPDNPGPHSSYSFAENSISYWERQGLEKEKMTLGVPFYGYDFTDQNNVTALTYRQMVNRDTSYANVDQVGQIYYNGIPTIARKTQLSLNEGMGGVMIWELGQDDFGDFSLLDVIYDTIEESITTSQTDVENSLRIDPPFPNPTLGVVNFNLHSTEDAELILYSNLSQQISATSYFNQSNISFDISNYPNGVYFVTLRTKSFIKTFKIIKN